LYLVQQELIQTICRLETMAKTLQAALTPLIILGSFFGLGLFEYPLGHSRPYFSCLYVLATWSFLVYFIYYPLYYGSYEIYDHSYFITNNWRSFTILITAITLIPVNFFYFKVKVLYVLIVSNTALLKFLNFFLIIFSIESKGVLISQL